MTVTVRTPLSEVLALCRQHKLTRLPVWETRDGQQRILGLATCNALLYQPDLDPAKPIGDYCEAGASWRRICGWK